MSTARDQRLLRCRPLCSWVLLDWSNPSLYFPNITTQRAGIFGLQTYDYAGSGGFAAAGHAALEVRKCYLPAASADIFVAWDLVYGATGYKIYYGIASHTYTNSIDVGNAHLFYTLTGLPAGTYYIALVAYNAEGDGPYSDEIVRVTPLQGGFIGGGHAAITVQKQPITSGGFSAGGHGAVAIEKRFPVSGGLRLGGVAVYLKTSGSSTFACIGSGGLISAGHAAISVYKQPAVFGGFSAGGHGVVAAYKQYPITGGFVLAGAAPASFTPTGYFQYIGSGGLVLVGSAAISAEKSCAVSGGFIGGGHATLAIERPVSGSGGFLFGGSAVSSIGFTTLPEYLFTQTRRRGPYRMAKQYSSWTVKRPRRMTE